MTTILDESKALLHRIVLIACGSFSPPTPMHLRMFEIARDHFELEGTHKVLGGIISPTHDAYGKKGLVQATHRIAMLSLALQTSDWVRVSRWETQQSMWTRTREVLAYHQNFINNYINSPNDGDENSHNWLPNGLNDSTKPVQVKLLCGADLLESFATPNLWADEDIEDIVANHGLVVISRNGSNPEKFIFDSDVLTKYKRNITLITNWVPNEVSSTMIRRLLSRGQSVKYLIDDAIINYIKCFGLYNCNTKFINDIIGSWKIPTDDNSRNLLYESSEINLNILPMEMINNNVNNKNNNNKNIKNVNDENIIDDTNNSKDNHDNSQSRTTPNQIKSVVFCCSDTKSKKDENNAFKSHMSRRQQNVGMPGQAVQVIVGENGAINNCTQDLQQINAKKMRISGIEPV